MTVEGPLLFSIYVVVVTPFSPQKKRDESSVRTQTCRFSPNGACGKMFLSDSKYISQYLSVLKKNKILCFYFRALQEIVWHKTKTLKLMIPYLAVFVVKQKSIKSMVVIFFVFSFFAKNKKKFCFFCAKTKKNKKYFYTYISTLTHWFQMQFSVQNGV